jgi:hypothetical protein
MEKDPAPMSEAEQMELETLRRRWKHVEQKATTLQRIEHALAGGVVGGGG